MHKFTVLALASALLVASLGAWAQVNIQPSDDDAKPFLAQGREVSHLLATDKSSERVLLLLDAASKTATITQFNQNAKGGLEQLKVSTFKPANLRPLGDYGTRVEVEENEYFGGKVHTLVLTCEGANVSCVQEQRINSVSGEAAGNGTQTYLKAHFKSAAAAQQVLAEIMKLRG